VATQAASFLLGLRPEAGLANPNRSKEKSSRNRNLMAASPFFIGETCDSPDNLFLSTRSHDSDHLGQHAPTRADAIAFLSEADHHHDSGMMSKDIPQCTTKVV
jgi:hypothetical protein